MIRIDEIYNHTFWPWCRQHLPGTRLFYCEPFGHTGTENLLNTADHASDHSFVYCHDQEPIYIDLHRCLFNDVVRRNRDLNHGKGPQHSAIITSELDSDIVTQLCSQRNWKAYYYFFHGWAALDWYRGYNRSFLTVNPEQRSPSKIFFSPNRIIGGARSHRLLTIYHLLRRGCYRGYYSFPGRCPVTHESLDVLCQPWLDRYPDMLKIFKNSEIPHHLPGETDHPMRSCWLDQFEAASDSMVYIVTETVAQGRRLHLTEKIFRPICLAMPFLLVSTKGSLGYLRSYGFETFDRFWDESYDEEADDLLRIKKVADIVTSLHDLTDHARQCLWQDMQPIIQHNYNHFYQGRFEQILWQELCEMLSQIKTDFVY